MSSTTSARLTPAERIARGLKYSTVGPVLGVQSLPARAHQEPAEEGSRRGTGGVHPRARGRPGRGRQHSPGAAGRSQGQAAPQAAAGDRCRRCGPRRRCRHVLHHPALDAARPIAAAAERRRPAEALVLGWCEGAPRRGRPIALASTCLRRLIGLHCLWSLGDSNS